MCRAKGRRYAERRAQQCCAPTKRAGKMPTLQNERPATLAHAAPGGMGRPEARPNWGTGCCARRDGTAVCNRGERKSKPERVRGKNKKPRFSPGRTFLR